MEDFFKYHRAEFDHLEPAPDAWERLQQARQPATAKRRTFSFYKNHWLKAAAALVLVSTIAIFLFKNMAETPSSKLDFADIELETSEGDPVSLSSLEGKVVLVKFWASTSTDCRNDNCDVYLPIYEKYEDKGFEIFAVSLDTQPQEWKDYVEEENLCWVQVCDFRGLDSPICECYDVTKVPTTYLLDRNMQIVAKDPSEEELEDKLQELLL